MSDDPDKDWDEYELAENRMKPNLPAVMLADGARDFQPDEVLKFFERLADGYGPTEIGLSLGWSDAMIKRFVSEPSRRELIDLIQEAEFESLERHFKMHAKAGNSTAMKMVAFNLMAHRGWADRREVKMTGETSMEVILSVRQALDETMRESITAGGTDAVAALQAGMLDDIVDADVVED